MLIKYAYVRNAKGLSRMKRLQRDLNLNVKMLAVCCQMSLATWGVLVLALALPFRAFLLRLSPVCGFVLQCWPHPSWPSALPRNEKNMLKNCRSHTAPATDTGTVTDRPSKCNFKAKKRSGEMPPKRTPPAVQWCPFLATAIIGFPILFAIPGIKRLGRFSSLLTKLVELFKFHLNATTKWAFILKNYCQWGMRNAKYGTAQV